jgi:hypothetical protein
MSMKKIHGMVLSVLLGYGFAAAGYAQDSAEQLLEQARAKAAEIEKLKKVINEEPDQNVRLAAFDLMVSKGDSVTRNIAIEAGLASADKLLQAAAFKAAIMDLERLHLTLVVDPDASEAIRELSQAYIDKNGDQYVLEFSKKDDKTGMITAQYFNGEVTGTQLSFTYRQSNGVLSLKDDDAVSGDIMHMDRRDHLKFVATGKIR